MEKTVFGKQILLIVFLLIAWSHVQAQQQGTEVFVQLGHSLGITSVDISPDGRFAVSSSSDNTIKLWELSTGKEIRTFEGHESSIGEVEFSPNGQHVASISGDQTLRLWDVASGREIKIFGRNEGYSQCLDFSPEGNYLVACSSDDRLKLWDVASGRTIRTFSGLNSSYNKSVDYSPDGRYIVSGSGNLIQLWDVSSGRSVRTYKGHGDNLPTDLANLGAITSVAFSLDGEYIISGSKDRTARIWDVNTAKEVQSFEKHKHSVTSVAFSPDGKYALSADFEGKLKLWDSSTGREIQIIGDDFRAINNATFSRDGFFVLTGSDTGIMKLWEIPSGRLVRNFRKKVDRIGSVSFSPNGKKIITANSSFILNLWSFESGEQVRSFKEFNDRVYSVDFSPDGASVATANGDGSVKILELDSGNFIHSIKLQEGISRDAVFSPDGRYVAIIGYDDGINLVNTNTGKLVRKFSGLDDREIFNSVAFSPDGNYILAGSQNNRTEVSGNIRLWEVPTGREIHSIKYGDNYGEVNSVKFSPSGTEMLAGGLYQPIKLWDTSTGRLLKSFINSESVKTLSFSPGGRYVISGHGNNLKLYRVSSGQQILTLKRHSGNVTSVTFSPDGKYILSGSADGTTRIWDPDTGDELVKLVTEGNEWVALTPEGYYNASENGADLMNVRIGNKVYSMDNFFETYYRPDIVRAKLAGKDISTMANASADIRKEQSLPPEVSIISPQPGQTADSQQATVQVQVTDQGGGIDEVRLYHNGKLVETTNRGLKLSSDKNYSYQIPLVVGKNVLEATAFNDDRIEARRDRVEITYEGAEATADLFVLAVGINEYKNGSLNLNYGRPDAEAFVKSVKNRSQDIFSSVDVTTLYDEQATRSNMKSAMKSIIQKTGPEDAFLLFYAGHGVMSESVGQQKADFYMALHETIQLYGNNDGLKKNGLSASELTDLTRRIAARKQMIVLDACQSGGAVETFAMRGAAEQKAIIQLARSAGLVVMASTGTQQYATEFSALGHGVFTYALLKGLQGEADGGNQDGKITVKELEAFINDRVPALTQKHRGQSQYPNSYARGQDFPIGVIKN